MTKNSVNSKYSISGKKGIGKVVIKTKSYLPS